MDGREIKVIPYPSIHGWVTTLELKVDCLISDYFATNYDQSTVFQGYIKSFQYTLAHYGHNPHACAEAVEADLKYLFGRYFYKSEVSVQYKDIVEGGTGYALYIETTVADGVTDALTRKRIVETEGTNYAKTMLINNEGKTYKETEYYYDGKQHR